MTIDTENLINSITSTFERMTYIDTDDIPGIDLYMDQVTAFLDERLQKSVRNKTDERLMTKTMINNYAKNDVIPPPVKKKYTKEHILVLIMIFYFKSFLQINDIKELLDPITESYFNNNSDYGLGNIYKEIFDKKGDELKDILKDVTDKYEASRTSFKDAPTDMREYLQLYDFICMLGCDVFVKKLLIEKIVDSIKNRKETSTNKYETRPDKAAAKAASKESK
ncbi:MAG: DUF1836 domain-containing protein [Lachnospiraceae bacterium]|nr:DUF1836 domain-containing protein [Lachnospiraceae bacterium]